jgi:cytochrome c oxidase assembly protein subunit 15
MFTFPPSKWVGGIFYEHGHRLIASGVGFLTIILTVWLWLSESRRWVRWLGVVALAAVVTQGVLGGLTVLFFLPAAVSTAHAALAEIFFCLVVSIALCTAPSWRAGMAVNAPVERTARVSDSRLQTIATTTTALIFVQILLGATMRHTEAGLAIPDFPLMFGHLLPTHWDPKIAVHFAHRVGALVVVLSVITTWIQVQWHWTTHRDLSRPATLLVALVAVQVSLGAATVLSALNVWINSLHVVCGALVLATSLTVTLKSWRALFPDQGPMNTDSRQDFEMSRSSGHAAETTRHGLAPNHGVKS